VVVIIIICLIGQDVLVAFNYFLALILVTPMSLLAIEATGQGGTLSGLLMDRLLGTLLGVAIAVLITWATSYRFPERLLLAQVARVETAIAAV
jgi:cell shape-determining protein MreD